MGDHDETGCDGGPGCPWFRKPVVLPLPSRKELIEENAGRQIQRADYIRDLILMRTPPELPRYEDFDRWRAAELHHDVNFGSRTELGAEWTTVWQFGQNHCPDERHLIEVVWCSRCPACGRTDIRTDPHWADEWEPRAFCPQFCGNEDCGEWVPEPGMPT